MCKSKQQQQCVIFFFVSPFALLASEGHLSVDEIRACKVDDHLVKVVIKRDDVIVDFHTMFAPFQFV